jgi:hypothetical protein
MADANFPGRYTQFFDIEPGPFQITGPVQSDGRPVGYTGGITSDADVTITARGRHGNNVVTLALVAGFIYPYELTFVLTASGAANITGLF